MTEALKAGQSGGDGQMCVWALCSFLHCSLVAQELLWAAPGVWQFPGDSSSGHRHIVNGMGRTGHSSQICKAKPCGLNGV